MRGKGGFCLLELVPGYHMMQKPIKLPDVIITPLGERAKVAQAQWGEHSPPTNVAQFQIPSSTLASTPNVG